MGSLSSLLTTMPGPSVAGPPANTMMRAPVFWNVVCMHMVNSASMHIRRTASLTSNRPMATERATPVQRSGRLSFATGHGSRWRASRMPVSWNSHCCTGIRNLAAPMDCCGMGCPGRGAARDVALRPSMSWICLGEYSFAPRKTYDLLHSA